MHHATTAKLFQQKKAQRQGEARVKKAEAEHAQRLAEIRAQHPGKTLTYDPKTVRVTMSGVDVTKVVFPEK